MNKIKAAVKGIAMLVLCALVFACATAPAEVPVQVKDAASARQGEPVYLFHGGSKAAKEEFCVNSVVPVYRYEGRHSTVGATGVVRNEVGKIRITKDLGDYYAQGVVVEGNMRNGDVAVQPRTGCLVRLTEP